MGADKVISEHQINDMTSALILDSMASTAIEQVCDAAEKEIKEKINKDNFMTWRFSPGYGDLPITLQREFVRVTDAEKRIGLTVNEGGILLPRKSVTAIIGLSKEPIPKQRRGVHIAIWIKLANLEEEEHIVDFNKLLEKDYIILRRCYGYYVTGTRLKIR